MLDEVILESVFCFVHIRLPPPIVVFSGSLPVRKKGMQAGPAQYHTKTHRGWDGD